MTRRQSLLLALAPLAAPAQTNPPFTLPKLPYAVDALEPFLDARTMEIHHTKHHQAYVDNLNKALAGHPDLAAKPLEALLASLDTLPAAIRTAVRNHGGGHRNHTLFWEILAQPKGGKKPAPQGNLAAAINRSFGSQAEFETKLQAAAMSVFGSGWAWLLPTATGQLEILTTPNQDNPWMSNRTPLLGIDVWEHAYYLKYQNRRADYLKALLEVLNWERISAQYEKL